MPIFYKCDRCTACCRWPGQVRLANEEITRLSSFLGLGEDEFIQTYTRINAQRNGLALMDKENGECIFLDGNDCRVNPVKPSQCRAFPNLWNFPGFLEVCKAKPVELDEQSYRQAIQQATGVELE